MTFSGCCWMWKMGFNLSILECKYREICSLRSCQQRFNLSILECKFCNTPTYVLGSSRFNLSILECKYIIFVPHRSVSIVLIYPYWNVNRQRDARKSQGAAVLIYPYWNVNVAIFDPVRIDGTVLIYPYWNVNLSVCVHQSSRIRF